MPLPHSTPSAESVAQLDLAAYECLGFLFLDRFVPGPLVGAIRGELAQLPRRAAPERVLEADGVSLRSHYAVHRQCRLIRELTAYGALGGLARTVLGDEVFVYQSKLNSKAPFTGDRWPWHRDYPFWHHADGMLEPGAVNVVLFLDEVTEFNGGIVVIPSSHVSGPDRADEPQPSADPAEVADYVSSDLKFTVPRERVAALSREHGLHGVYGAPGSVLIFHPNLVHASAPNISPFARDVLIVSLCGVRTPFAAPTLERPSFLCGRYEAGDSAGPAPSTTS